MCLKELPRLRKTTLSKSGGLLNPPNNQLVTMFSRMSKRDMLRVPSVTRSFPIRFKSNSTLGGTNAITDTRTRWATTGSRISMVGEDSRTEHARQARIHVLNM